MCAGYVSGTGHAVHRQRGKKVPDLKKVELYWRRQINVQRKIIRTMIVRMRIIANYGAFNSSATLSVLFYVIFMTR